MFRFGQNRRWSPYWGWFPRGTLDFDGNHRIPVSPEKEGAEEEEEKHEEVTGPTNHSFCDAVLEKKDEEEEGKKKEDRQSAWYDVAMSTAMTMDHDVI